MDSDGIELVANMEVGTKSALHSSLTTSNGETEGNRDIVNDHQQDDSQLPQISILFSGVAVEKCHKFDKMESWMCFLFF
jgi:hypothetical protein